MPGQGCVRQRDGKPKARRQREGDLLVPRSTPCK